MIDQFAKLVERGLPFDGCCDYLGISNTTFHSWRRKGTRYIDGDCEPPEDEIFGRFVNAIKKAYANYRLARLDSMHGRGNQYWARDMTILERRDRHNFSRNDPQGGGESDFDPDETFL